MQPLGRILSANNVIQRLTPAVRRNPDKEVLRTFKFGGTVAISDKLDFSFTMFAHRPEIYFGIYSAETKTIISGMNISDQQLEAVLVDMNSKYAHATSRKPPVVNKALALAWIDYFNDETNRLNERRIKIN